MVKTNRAYPRLFAVKPPNINSHITRTVSNHFVIPNQGNCAYEERRQIKTHKIQSLPAACCQPFRLPLRNKPRLTFTNLIIRTPRRRSPWPLRLSLSVITGPNHSETTDIRLLCLLRGYQPVRRADRPLWGVLPGCVCVSSRNINNGAS